eukprot:6474024-Amphidinium_carterae.3
MPTGRRHERFLHRCSPDRQKSILPDDYVVHIANAEPYLHTTSCSTTPDFNNPSYEPNHYTLLNTYQSGNIVFSNFGVASSELNPSQHNWIRHLVIYQAAH